MTICCLSFCLHCGSRIYWLIWKSDAWADRGLCRRITLALSRRSKESRHGFWADTSMSSSPNRRAEGSLCIMDLTDWANLIALHQDGCFQVIAIFAVPGLVHFSDFEAGLLSAGARMSCTLSGWCSGVVSRSP